MPTLPPWLNVSPADFVHAAESGAALGERVAARRQQGAQESARLATETQLAQARQAAAEKEAGIARETRRWEQEQQMRFQQQQFESQQAQATTAQTGLQQYRLGMQGTREEANRIAQQRADQAANEKETTMKMTMSPFTREALRAAYTRRQKAEDSVAKALEGLPSGGVVPQAIQASLEAANAEIESIQKQHIDPFNPITPSHPATASPEAALPGQPGQWSFGGGRLPAPPTSGLPEGARVQSDKTGKMGTVIKGKVVPDPDPQAPSPYRDLPGYVPTSGGSMYTGENLPALSVVPAQNWQ